MRSFTSKELLKSLLGIVIPLENDLDIFVEPPLSAPSMSDMKSLGNILELAIELKTCLERRSRP